MGLAVAVTLAGGFGLALMSPRFLDRVLPILGTNLNDATALQSVSDLFRNQLATAVLGLLLLVGAVVVAAVAAYRRRTGTALVLLTAAAAFVMLIGTHVLMDRLIDSRRTQQVFVERIKPHVNELGDAQRPILFATEQHELVYLMPDRFDSVLGVRDAAGLDKLFALKSRLAAAETMTLVVMEAKLWDWIVGTARLLRLRDPYIECLEAVAVPGLEAYGQRHREPLVLLRFNPPGATGPAATRPAPAGTRPG